MEKNSASKYSRAIKRVAAFLLLAGFWVVFSGKFDLFHLALGVVSCAAVAWLGEDLLFQKSIGFGFIRKTFRFIWYLPWLLYQVVLSNIHVARLVLMPGEVDAQTLSIRPRLKSDVSRVTLANSITLTPGTITIDVIGEEFVVHAISAKASADLTAGEMEMRIAEVFDEVD